MDKEIWKDIEGYEGLYQVSNWGNVKSLNYNHTGKEKLLSLHKNRYDYITVDFSKNGKHKTYKVHRLVLQNFAPCDNMKSLQVNHIDEDKTNNHLSNLEWVTHKENINHGTRNDRVDEKKSIPIVQLSLEGKYIRSYESSMDAEREGGFHQGNIINCCKGKRKSHGGYKWMYLSEFLDKYCGIID